MDTLAQAECCGCSTGQAQHLTGYNTADIFAQAECFGCRTGQAQPLTGQTACLGWGPVVRNARRSRHVVHRVVNPRFLSLMTSCDVAGVISSSTLASCHVFHRFVNPRLLCQVSPYDSASVISRRCFKARSSARAHHRRGCSCHTELGTSICTLPELRWCLLLRLMDVAHSSYPASAREPGCSGLGLPTAAVAAPDRPVGDVSSVEPKRRRRRGRRRRQRL